MLKQYVGYYEGYWRANLRKVTVTLEGGALHATGLLLPGPVELIPESDTMFTSDRRRVVQVREGRQRERSFAPRRFIAAATTSSIARSRSEIP